jgi:hypothetical protein
VTRGPAVQVLGAREVRRDLRKLGEGTRDMTATHRKVAALVLGPAQARTRRRSGALAGSYRVRASAAKASIVSKLVYAPVQEFGWPRRGITPSLALSGALEEARPAIVEEYQRAVAELVARVQAGDA